jgi:hypothetical protein
MAGRSAHWGANIVNYAPRLRALIGALIVMAAAASLLALGLTSSAGAAQSQVAAHPQVHSNGSGCDSWNGGNGEWSNAGDWSTGSVPTGGDSACISAAGTYTVTLEGDISVGSLTVGGGSSGIQTLAIDSNNGTESVLELETSSKIQSNGAIDVDSGATSSTFASSLDAASGATLVNAGTLDTNGFADQFGGDITNDAGGSVTLASTTTTVGSFAFANSGSFTVSDGSEFEGSGLAFTQSGGTFDNAGAVQFSGAPFNESGGAETGNPILIDGGEAFNDSAGTGSFQLEGLNTIDGTIPAGQTVTLVSSPSVETEMEVSSALTNDGTLVMTSTGASSSNNSVADGVLTNNGAIDVSGTNSVDAFSAVVIDNESSGVLDVTSPGSQFSNGTLNNEGTVEVGSGGGVVFNESEIYGVTVQSGKTAEVTGAGSVALSGSTLRVTTVGKLPKAKTLFTLIDTSGGVSGTFNTLDFPDAAYNVAYTPTTVTLTAEKPFKAKAKAVKATAGTSATVTVATLSKLPASGTITASINWGDSSATSAGTVTTSGTRGTVSGTHTYASAGHYTVTTTITDSNGTILTVTGKATVKS